MAARVARLESAQAAPRAPVTDPVVLGRLNAAENATKSLADNVAALSRRAEATDAGARARPEPQCGTTEIDKLTATLDRRANHRARSAAAGSDRASRLAVAASALRNAVEHGDPFTAELAIVKPLAPDAERGRAARAVRGLRRAGQRRARPGACGDGPADAARLRRSRRATADFSIACRPTPRSSSASARSARSRAATIAARSWRASSSAPRRATSPARWRSLPSCRADARAPLQAWIAKAEARNKALDASRRLAADAVAALKAAP